MFQNKNAILIMGIALVVLGLLTDSGKKGTYTRKALGVGGSTGRKAASAAGKYAKSNLRNWSPDRLFDEQKRLDKAIKKEEDVIDRLERQEREIGLKSASRERLRKTIARRSALESNLQKVKSSKLF